MSPEKWFDRLLGAWDLPRGVAAESPDRLLVPAGDTPSDPADRIIAATAREYDLRVVTRDRRLLAYAESGYCRALAC